MFQKARIKLTAWYLLIIMFVSISFSLVIFQLINTEVTRFAQSQHIRNQLRSPVFPPPPLDTDLLNEIRRRITNSLLFLNGSIFVISGGLSYFLAGKTLRPIKDMVEEQNQFVSDSSHEIRTPLTSLKSAFEVNLRDPDLNIKQARNLISESIIEVNKLQSLSDQLLLLAQYQKPNNYIKFENVFLKKTILQSVSQVKPLAKIKNIQLKVKVHDYKINANPHNLKELFTILLDNAIKYTPNNKVVQIETRKTDRSILIIVKDQGIGIDKKDLPHIFDRFYRADSARSKQGKNGFGLGLSIAQKIVRQHRGDIKVESVPQKGSIFTVHLPLK